jgi:hypothetical protein
MPLCEISRIVIAQPHLPLSILPGQCFERQIDTDGLCAFHKRGAALRITKNQQLGWAQCFADFGCTCRMVNTGEDMQSLLLHDFLEAVDSLLDRIRTFDRDQAVGRMRKYRHRERYCKDDTNQVFHCGQLRWLR